MTFDPKEVALNERNSSCPGTKDAMLEWFPNHTVLPALMELGDYEDYPELWNAIIDHNIGYEFRGCAWVTRSGQVWTSGWAKHEMLLGFMGLAVLEVENAGWLRTSGMPGSGRPPRGHICNRVSAKQKAFAKRHGVTLFEIGEDDPIITTPLTEAYENWKSQ